MIQKIKSFYSKNKQLVWLLGGVALFVLLTSSKTKTTSKSSTGSNDNATSGEDNVFPLSYGSKGKKVRALQRWLNYQKTTYNLKFTKTLNALRSVWTAMYGYPISEMTERQYIEEELLLHEEY